MKNTVIGLFFILPFLLGCNSQQAKKNSIEEAEICMKGAREEADKWLKNYNENGYSVLIDQQFPPPFDKIRADTIYTNKLPKWISWIDQEFGKVTEREFFGIHILLNGEILTYVPGRMNGFQHMSPRRFGLFRTSQWYKDNVEGTYAYIMYEAKPTKKERVEELIVLWLNKDNQWSFLNYYIDVDI